MKTERRQGVLNDESWLDRNPFMQVNHVKPKLPFQPLIRPLAVQVKASAFCDKTSFFKSNIKRRTIKGSWAGPKEINLTCVQE
jgi:hypothetical protein